MTALQRNSRGYIILTDKPARKVRLLTFLAQATLAALVITVFLFSLWVLHEVAEGRQRPVVREDDAAEIRWRLEHHEPDPLPLNTTVEITKWGYRYEWEGEWIPLAWAGPQEKKGGKP